MAIGKPQDTHRLFTRLSTPAIYRRSWRFMSGKRVWCLKQIRSSLVGKLSAEFCSRFSRCGEP
jgi:hypothetical protein